MSTPFDIPRPLAQLEDLLQAGEALLRIDEKHLGLLVRLELAALAEAFEHFDFVAQPGRLLESQLLATPRPSLPASP